VIEQLEATEAHRHRPRDPIDTTTPKGMLSVQVLGASSNSSGPAYRAWPGLSR